MLLPLPCTLSCLPDQILTPSGAILGCGCPPSSSQAEFPWQVAPAHRCTQLPPLHSVINRILGSDSLFQAGPPHVDAHFILPGFRATFRIVCMPRHSPAHWDPSYHVKPRTTGMWLHLALVLRPQKRPCWHQCLPHLPRALTPMPGCPSPVTPFLLLLQWWHPNAALHPRRCFF